MVVSDGSCYGDELATLPEHTPLIHGGSDNDHNNNNQNNMAAAASGGQEMKISKCSMITGLIFSSLAGVFMAVLPLPSLYTPPTGIALLHSLTVYKQHTCTSLQERD